MAKQCIYQVAVGEVPSFYGPCISSVERYCKRHGYDHIVQTEPKLRIVPKNSKRSVNALRHGYLPIYEKEAAFGYLHLYDRLSIIDADVFIRESAPDIFEESQTTFAAVVERQMPTHGHYVDKIRKYSEGLLKPLTDVDWDWQDGIANFHNMGVMVLDRSILKYLDGQTPKEFIERPEFERFVDGQGHWRWSTDQVLLNWWIRKSGMSVTNLDWKWNALYGAVKDISEAYFVHFFLSAKMDRKGAEIPDIIKGLQ